MAESIILLHKKKLLEDIVNELKPFGVISASYNTIKAVTEDDEEVTDYVIELEVSFITREFRDYLDDMQIHHTKRLSKLIISLYDLQDWISIQYNIPFTTYPSFSKRYIFWKYQQAV